MDDFEHERLDISLNIAEGAGELAPADKARFYRLARRSATEAAAILDAARMLSLAAATELQKGRSLLLRIVAMLGSGSGS